jgi:hypothetical protein
MTPTVSREVHTVAASKAMPGLPTGTTDFLLQTPETPVSSMTGDVPPLPVYHRGADMENITLGVA